MEARLSKKPVIGSNHGGHTEIIIDNETGFLVEPFNENELTKAIQKLLTNKKMREDFGVKGYERAVNEFSEEKYVTSFETLFV